MKHVVFVPCGGRKKAFDDFITAFQNPNGTWPILLVDSEDEVLDESKIQHLTQRDAWRFPDEVVERQVQLMATCMESWILYERDGLRAFYGQCLHESGLPSTFETEKRHRHTLFETLQHVTRTCAKDKVYAKGIAFQILMRMSRETLMDLKYFAEAYQKIKGHAEA